MGKISPKHDDSYLRNVTFQKDFQKYVDVYQDRLKGWFLDWAQRLDEEEHAGFAALQLALSYFEAHERVTFSVSFILGQ